MTDTTTAQEVIRRIEIIFERAVSDIRLKLADIAREFGGTADPPDDELTAYLQRCHEVDLDEDDEVPDDDDEEEADHADP